ncbi:MAG: 16S rRNA (cytidine(1402)-2'-O)-methyltransferase [Pyrinomonadaceae bacterium]
MLGTLYLVATPIGNLQDITFRAVEVLKAVDVIACEDTRHTRKLLNAFEIPTKLVSYHEHNEGERADALSKLLAEGKSVAVVSDAGTPGINDPGFRIVRKAIEIGADVVPIPGAVAFVNAVIASGLPTDSIFFGGFLPSKTGERKKRLREICDMPATIVFYETPHRIVAALRDGLTELGNRRAAAARELTKLHEEIVRGTLSELAERFAINPPRGEFVLVIDRASSDSLSSVTTTLSISERMAQLESEGLDPKVALKQVARERGIGKSEAYRLLQSEKQ